MSASIVSGKVAIWCWSSDMRVGWNSKASVPDSTIVPSGDKAVVPSRGADVSPPEIGEGLLLVGPVVADEARRNSVIERRLRPAGCITCVGLSGGTGLG